MPRRDRTQPGLVALLAPFLAATLACAGLSGTTSAPDAALTQAAGTLSAAATQIGTTLPIATAVGSPLAAPPTEAATLLAPTAESEATLVATPATGAPTQPPPASGSAIDPCGLITSADAQPLVGGVTIGPAKYQNDSCVSSNDSNSAEVALFVLPPAEAQAFLGIYVPALEGNGVAVDPTVSSKLTQDAAAGDMPAAVNDLLVLTTGMPGYHIEKLDGIGSAALWSWHQVEQDQEGALIAAQPGALVALIVFGPATVKETDDQSLMVTIVRRVLSNLPANFTLPATP